MKKVVINGRFLIHRVTGVQRYAREIVRELDRIVQPGEFELVIPRDSIDIPKLKNITIKQIGILKNRMWEHISLPLYVKKENAELLNLCNVAPILYPGMVCIFDMKIKVHPEFFSKKFILWYSFLFFNETRRAKLIFTDSISAKNDLLKYYPRLDSDRVKVVYPSWQHYERIEYSSEALIKYGLESKKFYFSMCSLEPNKNFKWIVEYAQKNSEQLFVIAGSINNTVFASGFDFECPANVKLIGYVSDEEAKTLMKECIAFLFPTIYEGFGMPPLEALSSGAQQVVVSDTEVMHEVFGNKVCFVNPYNADNVEIHSMSKKDRNEILDKFSWKESARDMYEAIVINAKN